MSDNPANPFATVTQVKAVYTDCGAHTITAWPGRSRSPTAARLRLVVSAAGGPTCGDTEFRNTANPYDEDPGQPATRCTA